MTPGSATDRALAVLLFAVSACVAVLAARAAWELFLSVLEWTV